MQTIDILNLNAELNGEVNKSLTQHGEAARFALILAAMEQDFSQRVSITSGKDIPASVPPASLYRRPALYAASKDIDSQQHADALQKGGVTALRLIDCLHPQALAFQAAKIPIPSDVIHNCDSHTQQRLSERYRSNEQDSNKQPEIHEDPTLLASILDEIHSSAA